tara:strand:+ start:1271 stop:3196 length:1926 start_codon:yes stop_codon:yes gene_type:complete
MFDFFRKGMGSMFAGGLLAILIVSFALWGIGDPLSTLGSSEIAEVGDEKLTPYDLERAFESEYLAIQQQAGDSLTKELAIQIGLGSQAVAKLVERKAYDVETANLGLRTSDEELREYIYGIPSFQDETGEFNRSYFDQFTRSQGYSTKDFEALLREEMARAKLIEGLLANIIAPDITASTLSKYASEKRTFEILAIPASVMTGIGEVNDELLKTYYDENPANYMAPEYRDISYFEISAAAIAATIEVSEEEALASYESRISEFTKEEERGFVQMLFDDQETADAAYADLEGGKSFAEVIVDRTGDTEEDATFDAQPRAEFADTYGEDAANLLYQAALDGYTAPIETGFGVYIFKVASIETGSSEDFETVRETVISDLKMDRAIDGLFDIRNVIDDELAAGSPIDTIATAIDAPLKTVSNVSIEGMTPDGTASTELPLIVEFLDYGFRNNIGDELELYEGISNKFYMLSVDNIIDSTLRDFEDVREAVNEDWAQSRRETLASELATRITDEYAEVESADKTLADYQGLLSQLTVNEVTVGRANDDNAVSAEIHTSIFAQDIGSIEMIPASNGDGYVLIRVKGREFADDVEESAINDTKIQIQRSYQNDLMGAYITHLYEALPVVVNDANVQATLNAIATPAQ